MSNSALKQYGAEITCRKAGKAVTGETKMKREQTTIRLHADLKEQIQREADKRGDSFNETVIRLLRKALK